MNLIDIPEKIAKNFHGSIVHQPHNVADTGVFNAEGLAILINETPDHDLILCVGPKNTDDTESLPQIARDGRSGEEILAMLQTHTVWLGINKVEERGGLFSEILDELNLDIGTQTATRLHRMRGMIQITSPGVSTPYHTDLQAHSIWQLQGEQSIHVYPRTKKFLGAIYLASHFPLAHFG